MKQWMRGWSKDGVQKDMLRPVSFLLLQPLMAVLDSVWFNPYEVLLFRCAFSLAFFGALRVREFASQNSRSLCPLIFSDIVLLRDSLHLCISRSETDQYGIVLSRSLFAGQSAAARCEFLVPYNGTLGTRFQFNAFFKKCLAALGLVPSKCGTHSFRIRAATVADASGLSDEIVKRLGRWSTSWYIQTGFLRGITLRKPHHAAILVVSRRFEYTLVCVSFSYP